MLRLFKAKEIKRELLIENVADVIIDIWAHDSGLKYEKFAENSFFGMQIALNEGTVDRFYREKLRMACSVAFILTNRVIDEDLSDQILQVVKKKMREEKFQMTKGLEADLLAKAKEYAKLRLSANPKQAGESIENTFANEVFGQAPEHSNTDARYLLYKQLSGFERTAIFQIGQAIRRSRR